MEVQELTLEEIEQVDGGVFNASRFLWGTAGAMFGAGVAVAGLGTPISVAGAVLAAGCASEVAASF